MIKLAVSGCQGRMGQTIANLALKSPDIFKLTTLLEHAEHPKAHETLHGVKVSTHPSALKGCDALIEFTLPEGTMVNLRAAVEHKVRMVIGTTGLDDDQIREIEHASEIIPIVFAPNMSIGVNILFKMIEIAGKSLSNIKDIYIGETHHVHKKDKPSGTAKRMKEIADAASDLNVRYDEKNVKREGEVVGYHEITFETEFDTLKISHNAKSRDMFAKGALTAAEFLMHKPHGLYTMQDVLGLH